MKRFTLGVLLFLITGLSFGQRQQWVRYEGSEGPGKGKHIVLISGDEEYHSEEALPMLGQILAVKYGFTCTVLFSIDSASGEINPLFKTNIPGLENLQNADLMIIFTRFRELPDEQMKFIDTYLKSGGPVIGLRTATHAFNFIRNPSSYYARYDYQSKVPGWLDGFGKQVLGETWVDHHGVHGKEGTRGLINGMEKQANNKLLNGVKNIWCPTDVYTITTLPHDAQILVFGQSTKGLTPSSPINEEKSIMPVAWTRTYKVATGKTAKVFATTMGASIDLLNEDLRRLIVNAAFWCVNLEKEIEEKANVDFIGEYKPVMFGFGQNKKGVFPEKYQLKMP